jgi:hypothetical protein
MTEKIAGVGLDVFVESNFREYMRVRRELAPNAIYNPTYDPDYSDLSMHNSFWLRAVDPSGAATAGVVDRNDGAPIASRLKVGLSSYS